MIIKLAMRRHSTTAKSLLHRETGVQHTNQIPSYIAKHYKKDSDKDLYFDTPGLKDRLKKAKEADKWKPRQLP